MVPKVHPDANKQGASVIQAKCITTCIKTETMYAYMCINIGIHLTTVPSNCHSASEYFLGGKKRCKAQETQEVNKIYKSK